MAALHGHGFAVTVLLVVLLVQCDAAEATTCAGAVPARPRPETVSIAEFGGVGDGRTVNTWAFHKAVYRIQHQRRRGGTTLLVPAGTWLTGSFNLTSHMTLFLARGAVLKATQVSLSPRHCHGHVFLFLSSSWW